MRKVLPSAAGVFVALVLSASPLHAQDGMHRLVIHNGKTTTVAYFGKDEAAARERARRENEAALADDVLAVRRQYVANESVLEARRHAVKMLLYGYTTSYPTSLFASAQFPGWCGAYPWCGCGYYGAGLGSTTHSLEFTDDGAVKHALTTHGIEAVPAPEKKN